MGKLFLIDAYSQIYRVFYAIRQLTNARGQPANALYGMARLFLQLDEMQPSDYGAIIYDLGKCTRRTALLPEYKAQRPPMPEELRSQTAAIREWADAFGWNIVDRQGYEADDLIAGLVSQRGPNQAIILTGDKDLFQLLEAPDVRILLHGKDKTPWIVADAAVARDKFGVEPAQIRDYLALLGDTADNIPGIPGCGPRPPPSSWGTTVRSTACWDTSASSKTQSFATLWPPKPNISGEISRWYNSTRPCPKTGLAWRACDAEHPTGAESCASAKNRASNPSPKR
ncbi:MAG: hypothetical protein J6Y80_02790 [Victivallales bacterium]|nr:hypothetical protein [Victivallales bacterium]